MGSWLATSLSSLTALSYGPFGPLAGVTQMQSEMFSSGKWLLSITLPKMPCVIIGVCGAFWVRCHRSCTPIQCLTALVTTLPWSFSTGTFSILTREESYPAPVHWPLRSDIFVPYTVVNFGYPSSISGTYTYKH